MEVKKTVSVDIEQKGAPFVLDAVQGEENTRVAELLLHLSGKKLDIDESDYVASIAYKKPDGTSGWYDTLSTGGDAYYWGESSITIKIDSQMLTVPGDVIASVRMESKSGSSISKTFPFIVNVSPDPANDAEKSENYYRVRNWDEVNAKIAELERLVGSGGGGNGEVSLLLDASLTQRGYAADAKAVGDALNERQEKGNYVKTVNNIKPDGNGNVSIPVGGGTGGGGTDGKDGGYYVPSVEQTSQTTVEFSFTPSDPDMPSVEPETITLPVSPGDGETPEIPFFDLAAMGLPAVTPDGTEVALAADTSEMQTALASGFVKFGFQFSYVGMTIAAELTGAPMYMAATDTYQVSKAGTMAGAPMFISIMVGAEKISAVANVLQAALPNAEGVSF